MGKGIKFSFLTSLISLGGASIIFLLNFYLFPQSKYYHSIFKSLNESVAVAFVNSFLVNLVCGSLAAFITAGFVNEKNCQDSSKVLASVKN